MLSEPRLGEGDTNPYLAINPPSELLKDGQHNPARSRRRGGFQRRVICLIRWRAEIDVEGNALGPRRDQPFEQLGMDTARPGPSAHTIYARTVNLDEDKGSGGVVLQIPETEIQ